MTSSTETITPSSAAALGIVPEVSNQVTLTEERYDFGHGEIMRVTPSVIRTNEAGEPVAPLLYVHGMNGKDKLPAMMRYIAEHDGRQVIGVYDKDKAEDSPKPVRPGSRFYRADAAIPQLDARRADDTLGALQALGDVTRLSIVAESGGGPRALLVAQELAAGHTGPVATTETSPIKVESLLLVDTAGLDGRSYTETHLDAVRLAVAEKAAKAAMETIVELPKVSAVKKQLHDRPEQRAVAHAQMSPVLADVARVVPTKVLSDVKDVAFLTERVAEQMRLSGAAEHAKLIQTDKGGHGVGLNKLALETVISELRAMEHEH